MKHDFELIQREDRTFAVLLDGQDISNLISEVTIHADSSLESQVSLRLRYGAVKADLMKADIQLEETTK